MMAACEPTAKPKNKMANNGNGTAASGQFNRALTVITIVASLALLFSWRLNSVESAKHELKSDFEKILQALKADHEKDIANLHTLLGEHAATESHPGTTAKLAQFGVQFTEVETQFKWKEQAAQDRINENARRIGELEADSKRRAEEWIPAIIRLQERVRELEARNGIARTGGPVDGGGSRP